VYKVLLILPLQEYQMTEATDKSYFKITVIMI